MRTNKGLIISGCLAMAFCQWLIYVYAPLEKTMGLAQKIFYLHLPLAWWGLLSFFIAFVASILYLSKKQNIFDYLAYAAVEIGVVLTSLTLITGMLWAKHSWGVWWTWDPRLTTALILWFLYSSYLIFRNQDNNPKQATICAVLGIIFFVDVPLVFLSARMWRSIHPQVFNLPNSNKASGLDSEMQLTITACILAFGLVYLALLRLRTKQIKQAKIMENLL